MTRRHADTLTRSPLVLFIVGPTASGKSALAVALAKKVGGEVLSADSMLVYKGMDIGTAKPTAKERAGVPHQGMDLIPPTKNFSVFAYRRYALKAIRDIVKRGKVPIVAGGTGFYVRALLEGLSPLPGTQVVLRRKLEQEALEKGLPALYERLLKLDPKRAKAIGPHNQRRIIRALEIYLASGKKPSETVPKAPGLKELGYRPVVIGIHRDREALYQKINRRVDAMFRKGLVREVKRLARKGFSATALQGVGYKETLSWIRAGSEEPLVKVKDRIKQTTRHFAKRQWTWFKRERSIRWVWWPEAVPAGPVRDFILRLMKNAF
ncbi:MAG: tRNA (adenosine(37)-N6)-dimethylallyltransferase MiaA [Candidatus Omnitrophota bacterium]